MSIKPDVYLMVEDFEKIKETEDEYAAHSCWLTKNFVGFKRHDFVGLYAIPDTHRVVSVELLKEAVGQLSELNTFAAIRAIIDNK